MLARRYGKATDRSGGGSYHGAAEDGALVCVAAPPPFPCSRRHASRRRQYAPHHGRAHLQRRQPSGPKPGEVTRDGAAGEAQALGGLGAGQPQLTPQPGAAISTHGSASRLAIVPGLLDLFSSPAAPSARQRASHLWAVRSLTPKASAAVAAVQPFGAVLQALDPPHHQGSPMRRRACELVWVVHPGSGTGVGGAAPTSLPNLNPGEQRPRKRRLGARPRPAGAPARGAAPAADDRALLSRAVRERVRDIGARPAIPPVRDGRRRRFRPARLPAAGLRRPPSRRQPLGPAGTRQGLPRRRQPLREPAGPSGPPAAPRAGPWG
jgi:hypothetical protein